jgi:hypothetical protein
MLFVLIPTAIPRRRPNKGVLEAQVRVDEKSAQMLTRDPIDIK